MNESSSNQSAPNILIVDDKPGNLHLLAAILERYGYRLRLLTEGRAVMSSVLSLIPDLILLDIMLPGMSGFEVCMELRKTEATSLLPIVLCSALNAVEDRIHGYRVGADNYLTKPINYNELKQLLASLLARKAKVDNMELQNKNVRLVLELASYQAPQLRQQNQDLQNLCSKVLMRNSLAKIEESRVLLAAQLFGVSEVLAGSQVDKYIWLENWKCASWLKPLLKAAELAETEVSSALLQELQHLKLFREWQILFIARVCSEQLRQERIPARMLIDVLGKQFLNIGCEQTTLDMFNKVFLGEDLLLSIGV